MQSIGKYQEVINKISHNKLSQVEIIGELLLLIDTLIQDIIEIDHRISTTMRYGPTPAPRVVKPSLKLVAKEEFTPEIETVVDEVKTKAIKALRAKEIEKTGPRTGHKYSEKQKKAMKMRRVAKSKPD